VTSGYLSVEVKARDGTIVPTTVIGENMSGGTSTKWDVILTTDLSIGDGVYSITLSKKNGDASLHADETDTFYRLYGDMLNARTIVNNANTTIFYNVYGISYGQTGYLPALDSDGNNWIDLADVTLFTIDLGRDLTWFTPSI
jgi:hypothetical protein